MVTIQGTLDNSGIFGGSGVVSVDSGGMIDNSGWLNVGPGSTLLNSGTIDTSGTVSMDGAITNTGTISNSGGFSMNTDGTLDNSGTFVTSAPDPSGLHIGGVFANAGLLDDQGATSLSGGALDNQLGGTVTVESGAVLANVGVAPGTINNYGTFDNYGANSIWLNETFNNYGVFNNFDSTGNFGTLNNNAAATINNPGYFFNNCGGAINSIGVINNMGTMTGSPIMVESCLSGQQASANVTAGSASTVAFPTIGLNVSIAGTNGTAEIIASRLTSQPTNTGGLSVNGSSGTSFGFYELSITGIMGGTANVCISNASADASTVIDYYSAGSWIQAANMTATPGVMVCGDIPVSALSGSPFAMGGPQTTLPTTTTLILGGVAVAVVVAAAGFFLFRKRRAPTSQSIEERIP